MQLGTRLANFYSSFSANFDLLFSEFSDRDSAFPGGSWWNATDFSRHTLFLGTVSTHTSKRMVLWQIPLGNTIMRSCDDSQFHYQDNRVQTILGGDSQYYWTNQYMAAGTIGFLFGGGQYGDTDVDDGANDGITNPAPINGNTGVANVSDDDGGYFSMKARAYYAMGALSLSPGTSSTTTTNSRSSTSGTSPASSLISFSPWESFAHLPDLLLLIAEEALSLFVPYFTWATMTASTTVTI